MTRPNFIAAAIETALLRQVAVDRAMAEAIKRETDRRRKKYLLLLLAYLTLWGDIDPEKFIALLRRTDSIELPWFSTIGYRTARGMLAEVPEPWRTNASRFVNSFAEGFLQDLKSNSGKMPYRRRTLLYGETGIQIAHLNGIQAAMQERGSKFWQRVLHPELSKAGPCQLCIADSKITHPIEEPFRVLHVNDVCSMSPVGLRFTGPGGLTEFGVPGLTQNEFSLLLGPDATTTVISK